ncbi:MAG TPA: hypothetical protein VHS03_03805 [Gaiellaceae bacterium]|nr:hypothetical protein [Gaiellaceae bacterium]
MTAVLLATPVAYGIWLVATPDEDGGRRPFGIIVLFLCLVAAIVVAAFTLFGHAARRSRS